MPHLVANLFHDLYYSASEVTWLWRCKLYQCLQPNIYNIHATPTQACRHRMEIYAAHMDSRWVLCRLMTSDAWHSCKSLLNTLGRAVEQLAGCLPKQAKVSSQDQSTTVMQCKREA